MRHHNFCQFLIVILSELVPLRYHHDGTGTIARLHIVIAAEVNLAPAILTTITYARGVALCLHLLLEACLSHLWIVHRDTQVVALQVGD